MRAQCFIRTIFVTLFDHLNNAVMFILRDRTAPIHGQRRCRHQRHGPVYQIKLLHQIPVVGREMNLFVKSAVRTRQRRWIVAKSVVFLDHFAQYTDFFSGGVTGGKPRGQPFQLAAYDVKFGHLVVVQGCNDQASPVPREQGLRLKPL